MTRLFVIGIVVVLASPQSARRKLPRALEPKDCTANAAPDELLRDRFTRKGGRTTPAKVTRQGSALMVDDVAQGRDLGQYDKLELAIPRTIVVSEKKKTLACARAFLWGHWQSRKRAYLILTLSSVDATGTSHIFVEPDDAGRWRAYWRIVRDTDEVDDLPTYYSVEWASPGLAEPGPQLHKGQEPDATIHELSFRDRCGEVEESL